MKEKTLLSIKYILFHFVLVIVLLVSPLLLKSQALLLITISQTVLIILYLVGYWEFTGIKFKYIYFLFLEIILLTEFVGLKIFSVDFHLAWNDFLLLVQLYLIYQLVKILAVIFEKGKFPVEIEFPLKNGIYLITDGGNSKTSRLMNYHYFSPVHRKRKTYRSMLYAADIVSIDRRSKGFLPAKNTDYPIFAAPVYCPIEGTVFKVMNDIPDNEPFSGNYPYNTGNTVVIRKDDLFCLLGHLKFGSIVVNEGEKVETNHLIAKIGNSGWSERPHLHMQLIRNKDENYWNGIGAALKYKQRNLYKNRIIRMKQI